MGLLKTFFFTLERIFFFFNVFKVEFSFSFLLLGQNETELQGRWLCSFRLYWYGFLHTNTQSYRRIKMMKCLTVHTYQSSQILILEGLGCFWVSLSSDCQDIICLINYRFCLHFCGIFHPKGLTAFHLLSIWSVLTLYWSTAATVSGAQAENVFNCV